MAQTYGFFNAVGTPQGDGTIFYDRVYDQADFAAYYGKLISNGVFMHVASALEIVPSSQTVGSYKVSMQPGSAFINGYWYNNDEVIELPALETASTTMHRKDAVGLRWDKENRTITPYITTGTYVSTPSLATAPYPTRSTDIYEIRLASIAVPANSQYIEAANVSDDRPSKDVCGWVAGLVTQIDVDALYSQFQASIERMTGNAQNEFDAWFADLDTQLSGDVAGNLQAQINANKSNLQTINTKLGSGRLYRLNNANSTLQAGAQITLANDVKTVVYSVITGNAPISLLNLNMYAGQSYEYDLILCRSPGDAYTVPRVRFYIGGTWIQRGIVTMRPNPTALNLDTGVEIATFNHPSNSSSRSYGYHIKVYPQMVVTDYTSTQKTDTGYQIFIDEYEVAQ